MYLVLMMDSNAYNCARSIYCLVLSSILFFDCSLDDLFDGSYEFWLPFFFCIYIFRFLGKFAVGYGILRISSFVISISFVSFRCSMWKERYPFFTDINFFVVNCDLFITLFYRFHLF